MKNRTRFFKSRAVLAVAAVGLYILLAGRFGGSEETQVSKSKGGDSIY